MDDSCAVCADALEWVAYGSCGHREVCSTCVVRLRFVLNDRRCCICKTECPIVFVTKALGDYTTVITDFLMFPANATEGQVGQYWYHEDTQAFFHDVDHYRMIKAMCRLSCSVCDKSAEEQGSEGTKRRHRFRSIEQLKGHLFHQHRLFMCSLCLEGRKVFICEQKLYTRSQLNQHISTGDSEVDGSESERGGFMGHPMCEFCRNPFYGDNELYMHMSTEHYTCHICQRQHPGQYDYYRNYDDLEMHFRQEHFLCENEACLAKKFVVFQTEAEMKRHNTIEHGGHMSRSKRNAALQIPTSFRFRRNEQEQRRGRGRGFRPEPSGNQLAMAIQASLETAISDSRVRDSSSSAHPVTERGETSQVDPVTGSLESLSIKSGPEPRSRSPATHSQSSRTTPFLEESSFPPLADRELPEPSSRYAQALSQSSRSAARLGEESFPPLPGASKGSKPKATHGLESLAKNTLAARLHQRSRASVSVSSARSRPSDYHEDVSSSSTSSKIRTTPTHGPTPASSISQPWMATKPARENGFVSPLSANLARNLNSTNKMRHSASAPSLVEGGFSNQATSSVVSAMSGSQVLPMSNQSLPKVEDVQTANKNLVERIRAGLGMDEDKYGAFKSISAEYRQGLINTWEYLSYVEQFGLSHLVPELARLCPDAQKQKELTDAYNANLRNNFILPKDGGSSSGSSKESNRSGKGKGKGKSVDHARSTSAKDALAENVLSTVRKLQSSQKLREEEMEVLSKDGYRAASDKLKLPGGEAYINSDSVNVNLADSTGNRESLANSTKSSQNSGDGGSSKQRKKTSKFHRVRLGDGSAAVLLGSIASPECTENESTDKPSGVLPVKGVWRNGGGQRLFANSQKDPSK
ncbi:E3 ubiquitin-protein ligase ZNF598 [Cocos nucifera]|uniref:RING-type E3 ubiquitin transferase n=1 Tax=Cocos nucifera TaxID=13894 RepID=A0A8K0IYE3_COCNU|nr:E3 ubiquitin-protein ligase ZNF598 [Cocos nucifera]